MSNYGEYNGDTEHDMWVDYGYHANTGELNDYFGYRQYSYAPISVNPRKSNTKSYKNPRKRLKSILKSISSLQSKIEEDKKLIQDIELKNQRSKPTPKLLRRYHNQKQQAEYRIEKNSKKIARLQEKIPSFKAAVVHENNMVITIILALLTCEIIFLFSMLLTTIVEV